MNTSLSDDSGAKPNVLLIMTDQHRWDAVGYHAGAIVRTPSLDRLAQRGTVFEDAYVVCPVCMASRAAILTGRYPDALRVRSMGLLPPTEVTLAETLKQAGYRTGLFGKLHLTPQQYTLWTYDHPYPIADAGFYLQAAGIDTVANRAALAEPFKKNYGFDQIVGVEDFQWGNYLDWLRGVAPEHLPAALGENMGCNKLSERYGSDPYARPLFPEHMDRLYDSALPAEVHPTRYIADQALSFIREKNEKPFFAVISFVDPHHPFAAPVEHTRKYPVDDMPVPLRLDVDTCYPKGLPDGVQRQISEGQRCPDKLWQTISSIYYAMISNIDDAVGQILSAVDTSETLRNTICIFTSDHGEHAGDHRLAKKGALLFDSLIRVPLVFAGPGVPTGLHVRSMVQEIDIFPTILQLLKLPVHAGIQGRSLLDLMSDRDSETQESILCSLDDLSNPMIHNKVYCAAQTIRTRNAKLIYFPNSRTGMLYDLAADPAETVNLFENPSYSSLRNDLMMLMLDRIYESKDPLPLRLSQA